MIINQNSDSDDSRWHMKGMVAAILPTGPEWILQIESESVLLFVRMDTEPKFRAGENCTISIETESMLMFDETEARLD